MTAPLDLAAARRPPTGPPPAHPLFRFVAALVARDPGPAAFEGTLALGIRERGRDTWWAVRFGARLEVTPAAPATARARLLLEAATARALLRTGRLPEGAGAWFEGDRAFAARAVDRLTTRTSWLGIRQPAARPARRRRRRTVRR